MGCHACEQLAAIVAANRAAAGNVRVSHKLPILLILAAVGLIVACCGLALADSAPPAVVSIGMTVDNLERSTKFYTDVLDFKKREQFTSAGDAAGRLHGVVGARTKTARLLLGEETLELTEYLKPRGRPIPADAKSNDRTFQHVAIIVSDMDKAYARLQNSNVKQASTAPQTLPAWNKNAAGIKAFYFRDPDGHFLEILQFPEGKGNLKWHQQSDALFLGIDHTAIVISDTERSRKFYGDCLGMTVVGESENYGIEQERLNNVIGARLHITTLRGAAGPAVEFLQYLSPSTGLDAPRDSQANDLWHWQINMKGKRPASSCGNIGADTFHKVSAGAVGAAKDSVKLSEAGLLRDPDGHAVRLFR